MANFGKEDSVSKNSKDKQQTAIQRAFEKPWIRNLETAKVVDESTLDAIDDSHVSELRHTSDTDSVKAQALAALRTVPIAARNLVWSEGVKVIIAPSVPEFDQNLKATRPRGFTSGGGYDSAAGIFDFKTNSVVIAEKIQSVNDPPHLYNVTKFVCHEVGHAFDKHLARRYSDGNYDCFSNSLRFAETYEAEKSKLSNSVCKKLEYFTQPNGAGASECFAELFNLLCGSHASGGLSNHLLVKSFPKCCGIVHDLMADPESARDSEDTKTH